MKRLSTIALCALVLSGCVQLLPDPPEPPRLYPLEPAAITSASTGEQTLAVNVPAGPSLALAEDIVWRSDGVLGVMSGASWSDRADLLLQRIFVHAFAEADETYTVVLSTAAIRADYELHTDVSQFEIVEEPGALVAVFAVRGMLVDGPTRRVIRTESVEVRSPVAARSASVAAAALQRSAREGASLLVSRLSGRSAGAGR